MARRGAARRRAGGGDGIPALREARARVALGAAAAAAAVGLAVYPPLLAGGRTGGALLAPGAAAVLLVLAALATRRESAAVAAVALLGGAYAAALVARGGEIDARAPLVAVGLALVPELSAWSAQAASPIASGRGVARRHGATLALVALASAAAGAVVVGVTVVETSGGLLWEAVGACAAVGALAVIRLARSRAPAGTARSSGWGGSA